MSRPPRYIVTVDRSRLDETKAKNDPRHQARPIRVEDTTTGKVRACRDVSFPLGARMVYGDPRQDGARVWIETEGYVERG